MKNINLFKTKQTGKELKEIGEVLKSGWWAMGKKVEEFEKAFAKSVGAKYAVATNSCTSALDVAIRCIKLNDPVKVSAFTFISSALCALNAGHRVQLLDIDPESKCTHDSDIQVLYAGNDFGKGIIYDMAHFGGGKHKGVISCWSFHAVKNIPTGDGGMLTTNDKKIYEKAKRLSWCGIDKSTYARSKGKYSWEYNIWEKGLKANMSDIVAAIGLCQLKEVKKNNDYRRKIAGWYNKYLPSFINRPFPSTTWHLYTITVPEKRNQLIDFLAENGVSTSVHYKPLYYYPIFEEFEMVKNVQGMYRNSEWAYRHILSLPMNLYLKEKDVKKVCNLIGQFYDIPSPACRAGKS